MGNIKGKEGQNEGTRSVWQGGGKNLGGSGPVFTQILYGWAGCPPRESLWPVDATAGGVSVSIPAHASAAAANPASALFAVFLEKYMILRATFLIFVRLSDLYLHYSFSWQLSSSSATFTRSFITDLDKPWIYPWYRPWQFFPQLTSLSSNSPTLIDL